jgi:O-antigen/teichoic acid export membrane protein
MVPSLSQTYMQRPTAVHATLTKLIWISAPLGLLCGLGLALVAHPLVGVVYGDAFEPTGDVLAILGGVLAARFLTSAAATGLVAVGWQRQRVNAQFVAALLNVGLNLLVIPRWGIIGAAAVFVLTEWVLVFGYLGLVWWWRRQNLAVAAWVAGA